VVWSHHHRRYFLTGWGCSKSRTRE